MKIEIKKDHPMTLVGVLVLGGVLTKTYEVQKAVEVDLDTTVLLPVFLMFIIGAYLLQIRKTIIFENGLFVFLQKKEKIEIKVSQIISVTRKGRLLQVGLRAGKIEFDVGLASRKDTDGLIELIRTKIDNQPELSIPFAPPSLTP